MKLNKKRKRQSKTDYRKRLILLKSKYHRLVVRKTNKYVIIQIIESKHAQDKVIMGTSTKELLKYGWPENRKGSLKSLGACYLAGLVLGKKAKEKKIEKIILDSGLIPNTKGSRVYSVIRGIKDSGIEINCSEKILPSQDRIERKIEELDFNKLKEALK